MELDGFKAQELAEFGKLGRGVSRIIPSVCVSLFGLSKGTIRGIAVLIPWHEPKILGSVATFTICCCPFAQGQLPA